MTDRARYFDHNATSPLRPEALEAMLPLMQSPPGNPSSTHRWGEEARYQLEKARRALAKCINASPEQVIFTSGGTESDVLALRGRIERLKPDAERHHIITYAAEHKAVLEPLARLRAAGLADVTVLPVDEWGRPQAAPLQAALRPETVLVSAIFANNETGALTDLSALAKELAGHPLAILHTDASQALGRIPLDFAASGADLMTLCAHKLGGPPGIGALVLTHPDLIRPVVAGGGQEAGLRGGTENVLGAVGFAAAAKAACSGLAEETNRLRALRDRHAEGVRGLDPPAILNTDPEGDSLPNTLNVSFGGCDSRVVVRLLSEQGFAASSGSACNALGGEARSHVLESMTTDAERVRGAVRFSFGPGNTPEALDALIAELPGIVAAARLDGLSA